MARARGSTRIWVQAAESKTHAAIEVFELPNSTLWTYDLRWDDSTIPPVVGDSTWVDDHGVSHEARFVLTSASFGVERYEQRWEQVMAWEVWEGSERLGTVLRSQGGTIGYDFGTGDLAFYSLEEPTEVLATGRYNNNFGELWLRQVIGTAVQSTYRYVIR